MVTKKYCWLMLLLAIILEITGTALMKFFAINGSHRKDGNTAQLLEKALEGIKSVCSDAEIESVNLSTMKSCSI